MPASRPDLDVEIRQELLDRFLRDYDAERRDGKTSRSMHEALNERLTKEFERLRDKIDDLREKITDARFEATGRFNIPPPIEVNVDRHRSHRPSIAAIQKVFADPKVIASVIGALAVASHLVRSCVPAWK
jgi:hypothetical protein